MKGANATARKGLEIGDRVLLAGHERPEMIVIGTAEGKATCFWYSAPGDQGNTVSFPEAVLTKIVPKSFMDSGRIPEDQT